MWEEGEEFEYSIIQDSEGGGAVFPGSYVFIHLGRWNSLCTVLSASPTVLNWEDSVPANCIDLFTGREPFMLLAERAPTASVWG